ETAAASAGRPQRQAGSRPASAGVVEEAAHVFEQEATITALAHAVVLQLATIAEALHGVDVEMEHLRDLRSGEHLPKLVQCHRAHPLVPFERWAVVSRATDTPRRCLRGGRRGVDVMVGLW